MIKLNTKVKGFASYTPPFPVSNFDGYDHDGDIDSRIEQLLGCVATLVSRFLYQFPHLNKEADELFSVGLQKVIEVVTDDAIEPDKVVAVCTVKCRRAMEVYANGLASVVKVSTSQQYVNRRKGVQTPSSQSMSTYEFNFEQAVEGEQGTLEVRDAAEYLGIDLEHLTRRDQTRLRDYLTQ